MNYASIRTCDIANGEGVRVSLFVSGCTHRCPGCFNKEAQDFGYGLPFTRAVEDGILAALAPTQIAGLSILGGEPMEPANQRALVPFLRRFRACYGAAKTLWVYTGCVYEELKGGKVGKWEGGRNGEERALADGGDGRVPFADRRPRRRAVHRGAQGHLAAVPGQLEPADSRPSETFGEDSCLTN